MSHQYATVEDLETLSVPTVVFRDVGDPEKVEALEAATSEADGYIEVKHEVPLTTFPKAVSLHVANMAAWHLIRKRGLSPDSDDFEIFRLGYTDGRQYFRDVAAGKIVLSKTETTPGATVEPAIESDDRRGWFPDC